MDGSISFGYWIKRRRKALDLTQDELAQRVGCATGTIKKIESDECRPSRQMAERLADCLEIASAEQATFLKAARADLAVDRLATPLETPLTPPREHRSEDPLRQPLAIKGYQLHEPLGTGGFGAVYRAVQPGVNREVAIKIIRPEYANLPEFIRRFEIEAQVVARLEHPFIVPLHDFWRESGGAYLVMRYVRGGNLQAALRDGLWALDRATRLLDQVGAALAFAHRHGVVHRDLKPANILLDEEGNAYLADFGIAKDLRAASEVGETQPGAIVGSPAYLSPEQLRDELITPRADIYGLGVLLYELLTGAHPFANLPAAERLGKQLYEPLPPLHARRPELPTTLDDVIQRATAKAPTDRYPDIVHMVAAWQQAATTNLRRPTTDAPTVEITPSSFVLRPTSDAVTLTELAVLENPYKGLRAFGAADACDFFGRASLTRLLLERLAEEDAAARFLAVVGPSGSGKSSVVRAGLLPTLRRGEQPGSEQWFIVEVLPGAHPLEELEAALLRVAVNPPPSLLEQLAADERGLARAVKRVLPADLGTELVLVIDQFEELFTLTEDEAARAHFLGSLYATVIDPHSRLRVIVTLRADFYDRPLLYSEFGQLIRERTEVVLPLTPEELQDAIIGPAARVGMVPAPDLVAAIVKDVGDQPGTLPLLQYALTELFEHRAHRRSRWRPIARAAVCAARWLAAPTRSTTRSTPRGRQPHGSCSCDWSRWAKGSRIRVAACGYRNSSFSIRVSMLVRLLTVLRAKHRYPEFRIPNPEFHPICDRHLRSRGAAELRPRPDHTRADGGGGTRGAAARVGQVACVAGDRPGRCADAALARRCCSRVERSRARAELSVERRAAGAVRGLGRAVRSGIDTGRARLSRCRSGRACAARGRRA